MKANEIRIGNLSERINKSTDEKMTIELTASCILDISSNGNNSSFVYKPIPLTEEWLLKFGFNIKKDNKFYHKEKDRLYVDISNQISIHLGNKNGLLKQIDYVHQLQNLYFALTNEELTLKQN